MHLPCIFWTGQPSNQKVLRFTKQESVILGPSYCSIILVNSPTKKLNLLLLLSFLPIEQWHEKRTLKVFGAKYGYYSIWMQEAIYPICPCTLVIIRLNHFLHLLKVYLCLQGILGMYLYHKHAGVRYNPTQRYKEYRVDLLVPGLPIGQGKGWWRGELLLNFNF